MAGDVPAAALAAALRQVAGSAAILLGVMARYGDLPQPVGEAAAHLQRDLDELDLPPAASDEDRIRDAMAEARDHPGHVITR